MHAMVARGIELILIDRDRLSLITSPSPKSESAQTERYATGPTTHRWESMGIIVRRVTWGDSHTASEGYDVEAPPQGG